MLFVLLAATAILTILFVVIVQTSEPQQQPSPSTAVVDRPVAASRARDFGPRTEAAVAPKPDAGDAADQGPKLVQDSLAPNLEPVPGTPHIVHLKKTAIGVPENLADPTRPTQGTKSRAVPGTPNPPDPFTPPPMKVDPTKRNVPE